MTSLERSTSPVVSSMNLTKRQEGLVEGTSYIVSVKRKSKKKIKPLKTIASK
jgi:hypothetical protein